MEKNTPPMVYPVVGGRVQKQLWNMHNTPDVFWDKYGASYVLIEGSGGRTDFLSDDGTGRLRRVFLVAINGAGEIRWTVEPYQIRIADRMEADGSKMDESWDCVRFRHAARHFGLQLQSDDD